MVGNGVTDWTYDMAPAFSETAYWHSLYGDDLYNAIKANDCQPQFGRFATERTPICMDLYEQFAGLTTKANINIYNMLGICYLPTPISETTQNDAFELYNTEV